MTGSKAIRAIAISSAALLAMLCTAATTQKPAATTTTTVTIHADKPGATINKNVYGQFSEHLGDRKSVV